MGSEETFIFLASRRGVGGWQAAVWRVVPAKCGQVSCRGQVLAATLATSRPNHTLRSRDKVQVRCRELTRGADGARQLPAAMTDGQGGRAAPDCATGGISSPAFFSPHALEEIPEEPLETIEVPDLGCSREAGPQARFLHAFPAAQPPGCSCQISIMESC